LVDCKAQQINRIFLTWILNIFSSKQIVCCDRNLACKRNDQAFGLIILSNFENLNHIMVNWIDSEYTFFLKNRTRNRNRSPRLETYGVIE
jgi:hypothetical protein